MKLFTILSHERKSNQASLKIKRMAEQMQAFAVKPSDLSSNC